MRPASSDTPGLGAYTSLKVRDLAVTISLFHEFYQSVIYPPLDSKKFATSLIFCLLKPRCRGTEIWALLEALCVSGSVELGIDMAKKMADMSEPATLEATAAPEVEVEDLFYQGLQRQITVYDAVAGRAGINGFLSQEQRDSDNVLPIMPEEVLLGRSTIPKELIYESYDAAGELLASTRLPDSEVLKSVHAYASDFYSAAAKEEGKFDFKSLDETALIAIGILLEEAVREALGQNGDMVFVEPEGLEDGLDETKTTKHQVKGRVEPAKRPEEDSEDALKDDESPAKKQRR